MLSARSFARALVLLWIVTTAAQAVGLPAGDPSTLDFSPERLARIRTVIQGEIDGVRLLSPTTVRYMTADHLTPGQPHAGAATLRAGIGFEQLARDTREIESEPQVMT